MSSLGGDVLAEVECRSDGEADGIAAILQQVVKQVIVDQIGLGPQAEVVGEQKVEAAAEADEPGPVRFVSRRDQSRIASAYTGLRKRVTCEKCR